MGVARLLFLQLLFSDPVAILSHSNRDLTLDTVNKLM